MRKHVAQHQACIRCSKRNGGERKEGRDGGGEKEREGRGEEEEGERERKYCLPAGVRHCAGKNHCHPKWPGVPITHQGTAAIFQS